MKKFLLKLMTVVLAVAMITGTMASCGLFEVDTDRDLERVVATVNIGDGMEDEAIYKRELINGFMSYGYMYVQNYGYSASETYELILDNLINNKIIMQHAKKELAPTVKGSDEVIEKLEAYSSTALAVLASSRDVEKYVASCGKKVPAYGSVEYVKGLAAYVKSIYYKKPVTANDAIFRFLDFDAILKTFGATIDSVNSLVASFEEDVDTHEHETLTYTARTTPTMDEDEEETLTTAERNKLLAKEIDVDRKALEKAIDRFVDLGLIDSEEVNVINNVNTDSVLCLTYFKSALVSTLESEVITDYEDHLREKHHLKADNEAHRQQLWESYVALKAAQEQEFAGNVSSLESALGAISETSFVAYLPSDIGGYGYVSHFLIQYDADLKAELDEKIKEIVDRDGAISVEDKNALINEYAQKVIVEDQRATWVQSGYGVLEGDQVIRFTDDYVYDTEGPLAYYDGSYERVISHEEEDENGEKTLSFNYFGVKPEKRDFAHFDGIVDQIFGADVAYGVAGQVAFDKDLEHRFEDLKFAYSTDEGNFNKYLGYLYSPVTSDTQFVSAFAEASKEVCELGAGAYKMFGSYEYGLHIVLCTKVVTDLVYADFASFAQDLIDENEDSVAYQFLEATNALLETNIISQLANTFIQDADSVSTRNEKVYKDLIEESAE